MKNALTNKYGYSYRVRKYDVESIKGSLRIGSPAIIQSTSPEGKVEASLIHACLDRQELNICTLMIPVPDLYEASGLYFRARDWGGGHSTYSYFVMDGDMVFDPLYQSPYKWDPAWHDDGRHLSKEMMDIIDSLQRLK